ncbi:MAG TPA: potassium-transporting ATPase subunit C [Tepidisphaeraceae bacterium]|nr:potassium-transporting ATPase subunit C [Tepidisphaeraceae bacterium]
MKTNDAFAESRSHDGRESGGSWLGHIWASIAAMIVLTIICCGVYPVLVWGIAQAVFPNQANGSLVKKDGTYTTKDEEAVGSALLGQNFSAPQYFHPRPSSAGAGYDAANSSGSNLGPLSDKLLNGLTNPPTTAPTTQPETLAFDGVRLRTIHYALDNGITFKLYSERADGTGDRTEVPLSKFHDAQGNLNDIALVDAFPHASDTPDRSVVIAADFSVPIPADAVTASGSGLDPHISPANAKLQQARIAKARNIPEDAVAQMIDAHTNGPDWGILGDPGVNVLMLNLSLDAKYPVMPSTQPAK